MARAATTTLGTGIRRSLDRQGTGQPSAAERFAQFVWQSRWPVLALLSAALFIALISFNRLDPSWSHAAGHSTIHNAFGRVGAFFSDLWLYLFGRSAYWFCLPLAVVAWRLARRIYLRVVGTADLSDAMHKPASLGWQRLGGAVFLLIGSLGLEATRTSLSDAGSLPFAPGGVLGDILSTALGYALGDIGSTLVFLLALIAGVQLFSGVTWLRIFEATGTVAEWLSVRVLGVWRARQDRVAGAVAATTRDTTVRERKRELDDDFEPLTINVAPKVEPSKRAMQERQVALPFQDLPADTSLPGLSLLAPPPDQQETVSHDILEYTSRLIEKKLGDFGVQANVLSAAPGPVITMYEIEPATGVKGSQLVGLAKDLARALSVKSLRVVENIPGKAVMGLELPNPRRQAVRLSEILGSQVYAQSASPITLALGKDIAGNAVVADLARMPHLLVAGTTGSGKSVGINAMLLSLLYKADPSEVRLILIDPKMLEMSVYEGIPHLLAPVVTDMRQAGNALNWCVAEMERRYRLMSKMGVRNLSGYNKKIGDAIAAEQPIPNPFSLTPDAPEPLNALPQIVVVIDELADLMMVVGKKIEELIARLAQKARAAGIHLILATQRPSVDVITGLIKANIPTRIAFQVSSKIDSRTILDQMGAEALLGQGDMLYMPPGTGLPQRIHGAFVADDEVHRVVEYWKANADPQYIEGLLEGGLAGEDIDTGSAVGFGGLSNTLADAGVEGEADALYDQAVEIVLRTRRASISLVQRHLRIGYNRAARLLEQMEKSGIVSPLASNGNRDILVPDRREARAE
jgi:DNA segregation ATPase FtsK/SpoIIIE, S-DNA-T family